MIFVCSLLFLVWFFCLLEPLKVKRALPLYSVKVHVFIFLSFFFLPCEVSTPVTRAGGSPLSTGALVGIAIGVGVLVLLVLVICCVVYRRQKRQIDEYKEIYFLRSSDYQVI